MISRLLARRRWLALRFLSGGLTPREVVEVAGYSLLELVPVSALVWIGKRRRS